MGNTVAACRARISVIGGMRTNGGMGSDSHSRDASLNAGNHSREGQERFLRRNPKGESIGGRGAWDPRLITGYCRAITWEVHISHGCYSYGRRERHRTNRESGENIYIWCNSYYLWWGKAADGCQRAQGAAPDGPRQLA
jgi:hypothetical protein